MVEQILGGGRDLFEALADDRRDEGLLRREAAEHGSVADPGALGDLVDARAQSLLGENLGRGVEHAAEVALSVCPERRAHRQAALAKTGSLEPDRASASMRATSLARSRTSNTTRAATTITAAPP